MSELISVYKEQYKKSVMLGEYACFILNNFKIKFGCSFFESPNVYTDVLI